MGIHIYLRKDGKDMDNPILPFRRSVYYFLSEMGNKWECDEQWEYDEFHYKAKAGDVKQALIYLTDTYDVPEDDLDEYNEYYLPVFKEFLSVAETYPDDEYIYFTKA